MEEHQSSSRGFPCRSLLLTLCFAFDMPWMPFIFFYAFANPCWHERGTLVRMNLEQIAEPPNVPFGFLFLCHWICKTVRLQQDTWSAQNELTGTLTASPGPVIFSTSRAPIAFATSLVPFTVPISAQNIQNKTKIMQRECCSPLTFSATFVFDDKCTRCSRRTITSGDMMSI